jgi:hypothetical protein
MYIRTNYLLLDFRNLRLGWPMVLPLGPHIAKLE